MRGSVEGEVDVVGVQLEVGRVEALDIGVRVSVRVWGKRSGGFVEEKRADPELKRDVSGGGDEGVPGGRGTEEGCEAGVGGVAEPGSPHAAGLELPCQFVTAAIFPQQSHWGCHRAPQLGTLSFWSNKRFSLDSLSTSTTHWAGPFNFCPSLVYRIGNINYRVILCIYFFQN